MAHIQKAPIPTHESESTKNSRLVKVNAAASAGSHGARQSEVRPVSVVKVVANTSAQSGGLEIAGLPWQFVAVIAVIVLGVLAIILRSVLGT